MYMYVRMISTLSRVWINPGMVANPARSQLNRENGYFPIPVRNTACEFGLGDGLGGLVPRQPAHFPHSDCIWRLVTGFLPLTGVASIYLLYRHTPSGQSRCRESTGTGPAVLKVVRVTDAAFSGFNMDQFLYAPIFPHTHNGYEVDMCDAESIAGGAIVCSRYAQVHRQNIDNVVFYLLCVYVVVVFFTLTDRASTIPSNTRGCQSGTVRGLLDRKRSEEYLQSSNESIKKQIKQIKKGKNDKKGNARKVRYY